MSVNAATDRFPSQDVGLERLSLVDVMNHELRTPLASLVGHIELLQELDLDLSEQAERSFAVIVGAASRLADLADTVSRVADRQAATWSGCRCI